ncbi:MAG: flippase-like domain-containing protein [Myxococcales bacterium]|nr:flippase-like domain-containing protein [Myxococcales bacterium]MBL0195465.1 flippase-like domain-containing protein [Myxococcales bacterium]HQY61380.1 lysylphosphatidylglycerol synthase transmembrane domain-containing protein [Polyangiaceae bacterium]
MTPKTKQRVAFLAKLAFTGALLTWLARKGALDMRALGVFLENTWLLLLNVVVFCTASVFIATVRWRLLVNLSGAHVGFWRSVSLQFVSLFFNVVIPGNVGGDVLKALYVARDEPKERRAGLLLVAFVERVVGLAGLITVGLIVVLVRGRTLWQDELFRPLISLVLLLGAGFVVGPAVFVLVMRSYGARLEAVAEGSTSPVGRLAQKVIAAFRLVSARPSLLLASLGLSMALHGTNMLFFMLLAAVVGHQEVTLGAIATIYPIGLLSLMLPVSAAGMGVGHMAFEKLFTAVSLQHGADVFNVFFFGQIAPCVFGVIPYLALRAKAPLPTAAEAAAAAETPPAP